MSYILYNIMRTHDTYDTLQRQDLSYMGMSVSSRWGGGGVWGGVESRRSLCRKLFTSGGSFNREIRCITRFIFWGGEGGSFHCDVLYIGKFAVSQGSYNSL